MKPNRNEKRYQVPKERRLIACVIDYVPGYAFLIFMVLFFVYAKNKGRAEDEGLWAGRGGGYEIGNTILWQDGTTTRRIGNAWISNDGQTLCRIRNYWLETTPRESIDRRSR